VRLWAGRTPRLVSQRSGDIEPHHVEHDGGLPAPILDALVTGIRDVLGDDLAALWLYGSSVSGDFEPGVSDIDTIAVTTADIATTDLAGLERMHEALVARHAEWRDRIEVVYVARATLESFRASTGAIAMISPGEPLHFREERPIEWLQNWYLVRETGMALHGPAPVDIVPPITWTEFIATTMRYADEVRRRDRTAATAGAIAYDILTACRALRTIRLGTASSKTEGAAWVSDEKPEWRWLIDKAVDCRASRGTIGLNDERSRASAESFIGLIADEIARDV
jgi:predicted nucleotidyltransferase